jgi:Holliday junction resolvase RusA-like endonuclease
MIVLHVSGTPRPKQSARFVKGRVVSVERTNKLLKLWKASVRSQALRYSRSGGACIDGAVRADIDFYFATPKRERWGQPHTHVPDKDNLEKAVLDALKDTGVFTDDKMVAGGAVFKWWSEAAGAVIVLKPFQSHVDDSHVDDGDDLGAVSVDGLAGPL